MSEPSNRAAVYGCGFNCGETVLWLRYLHIYIYISIAQQHYTIYAYCAHDRVPIDIFFRFCPLCHHTRCRSFVITTPNRTNRTIKKTANHTNNMTVHAGTTTGMKKQTNKRIEILGAHYYLNWYILRYNKWCKPWFAYQILGERARHTQRADALLEQFLFRRDKKEINKQLVFVYILCVVFLIRMEKSSSRETHHRFVSSLWPCSRVRVHLYLCFLSFLEFSHDSLSAFFDCPQ